jgi:GrpB-like predicted nucleotidyltransferase (UPF0157 family)
MAPVILVEYQSDWPRRFREAAAELLQIFAGPEVRIEHIGSTAVEGLCAKPVIDIMLGAADLPTIESGIPRLVDLGYRYKPEHERVLPGRRYFSRPAADTPQVHLHAVVVDGEIWCRQLAFRDGLRGDPDLARRYAELKRRLADEHPDDRSAYTDAKGPFIAEWFASRPPPDHS